MKKKEASQGTNAPSATNELMEQEKNADDMGV